MRSEWTESQQDLFAAAPRAAIAGTPVGSSALALVPRNHKEERVIGEIEAIRQATETLRVKLEGGLSSEQKARSQVTCTHASSTSARRNLNMI